MTTETKFLIGIGILTTIAVIAGAIFLSKGSEPKEEVQIDQDELFATTRHTTGDPSAPVQVVEFGDFECPACAQAFPIIKKVLVENGDKIYYGFKHYPLSIHKHAKIAAQAAEAASVQDKFWEMHDILFERQNQWAGESNPEELFITYAEELELDIDKFKDDINRLDNEVEQDFADGNRLEVSSTPTFFINGTKYSGVVSEAQFQQIIQQPISE